MSDNVQMPGNGLQVNAGPVTVAASGGIVVQLLLAIAVVAAVIYSVYTVNERSAAQQTMMTMQHNAIMAALVAVTTSNENLFLSSMLPDARKKDLPEYVQNKARAIVERRAEKITDERQTQASFPPAQTGTFPMPDGK